MIALCVVTIVLEALWGDGNLLVQHHNIASPTKH